MRPLKIYTSITIRTEMSLEKYLTEIDRIPMIRPEQEAELAHQIHSGGRKGAKAKEKLITSNLRFVVSVAKQYQHQGVPLTDLINEGNLGLMAAVDRFDETRGFKFISYAIWWIRQSILQAIANYGNTIRNPQNQIGINNKVKSAINSFAQMHQRMPSVEELCEITSLEADKIKKAIEVNAPITSIDTPRGEDEDGGTIADSMFSTEDAADRHADHESMYTDLILILNSVLDQRERTIIIESYGIGCQERELADIGNDMGLSRERVRQIRNRGIEKIQNCKESKLLLKYLGS